jgi:hypothetical protein
LGDALGIGDGIIRRAGSLGNAIEIAAADAVAALGVGAAVGDAAIANGATDRLFMDALFVSGLVDVDLGVEVSGNRGNEPPQESQASCRSLVGAVLAERVGLALRFTNEGSEPGREAVR